MKIEEHGDVKWVSIFNGDDPSNVMEAARSNKATDNRDGIEVFRVRPQFGIISEDPILVDEKELRQLLDTSKGSQQ